MKKNIQKSAKRRLAIVAGQVRGIQEMVDQEKYCVDVITQIEAVREALAGVGQLLLRNHLETHVSQDMRRGKDKKATAEVLKIYRLAQK